MSGSPVSDASAVEEWSREPGVDKSDNSVSRSGMKGPSNLAVRSDLFPVAKPDSAGMEFDGDDKNTGDDSDFSKWNDAEQLKSQVVFINPEWDEIEEEKSGIPTILNSITPDLGATDKSSMSHHHHQLQQQHQVQQPQQQQQQITEFVVTDTESVSSVTVSLDEFAEESEEIVAVISDSEADALTTAGLLTQMEPNLKSPCKLEPGLLGPQSTQQQQQQQQHHHQHQDEAGHLRHTWPSPESLKGPATLDPTADLPVVIAQTDPKVKPGPDNYKKRSADVLDTTKLMKASCYVMQNGKITKPFYIVKNPILREDTVYKNINKCDDGSGKKGFKMQGCHPEEERNLLPLGRNVTRKKDPLLIQQQQAPGLQQPGPLQQHHHQPQQHHQSLPPHLQPQQLSKFGRNQEFIRIIEHPARGKKIIVNKMTDTKPQTLDGMVKKSSSPTLPTLSTPQILQNQQQLTSSSAAAAAAAAAAGVGPDMRDVFGRGQATAAVDSTGANSCESEDLMWLLDFKLDDLFSESSLPALSQLDDSLEQYTEFPGKFVDVDGSVSNFSESDADDKIRVEIGCQTETMTSRQNKIPNGKMPGGGGSGSSNGGGGGGNKQQHKLDGKSAESALPSRTFSDLKCSENRKPPFTYTELIECALQEKGPLTVSEIYNWISETFPYYKSWDDRWKNSVRHNLSINPYFRKGTKARQGSGHLWTVNKSEDNSKINNWKRHRFHEFEEFSKRLRYAGGVEKQEEPSGCVSPNGIIDETELATASIEDKENRRLHRDVLMATCFDNNFISTTNVSLEQSAEEILSGVKKNVEVQYLEPVKSPCEDDFLNPISKEILMGECGLLNQIELNLTAETGEHLSIVDSMTDPEHIFGIPDELNFHYDIPSHAPQLLPLAK